MPKGNKKSDTASKLTDDDREDLRAAYQAVPQMIAEESEKQWSATSVFIQLSIALVAASLTPNLIPGVSAAVASIFGLVISLLGLVASIIWLSYIARYEKIVLYWILAAREIEEKMSSQLMAFRRGKELAHGNHVQVSGETVGYRTLERLPVRIGLFLTYAIFILIYVCLVALNILRLWGAI